MTSQTLNSDILVASNQMTLEGVDADTSNQGTRVAVTADLNISLANDYSEVRGFGKPITKEAVEQMVNGYAGDIKLVEAFLNDLATLIDISDPKLKTGYETTARLVSSKNQTVAGVFGKEIILQILAQRNCEGIRYVVGKYEDKSTIMLLGVTQNDKQPGRKDTEGNILAASSAIISDARLEGKPLDYIIGEVHGGSLTLGDVSTQFRDRASDVILGTF